MTMGGEEELHGWSYVCMSDLQSVRGGEEGVLTEATENSFWSFLTITVLLRERRPEITIRPPSRSDREIQIPFVSSDIRVQLSSFPGPSENKTLRGLAKRGVLQGEDLHNPHTKPGSHAYDKFFFSDIISTIWRFQLCLSKRILY
jgi:hypothetical protein